MLPFIDPILKVLAFGYETNNIFHLQIYKDRFKRQEKEVTSFVSDEICSPRLQDVNDLNACTLPLW